MTSTLFLPSGPRTSTSASGWYRRRSNSTDGCSTIRQIPVVLIESWIIQRLTGSPIRKNLKPVAIANAASTLLGYPFAWLFQFALQCLLMITLWPLGNSELPAFLNTLPFQVIGFTLGAAWLMPFWDSFWWMVPVAGMIGLIPAFYVSVYCERYVLARVWKDGPERLHDAVLRANMGSYALLFVSIGLILLANFLSLDPVKQNIRKNGGKIYGRHDGTQTILVREDADLKMLMTAINGLPDPIHIDFQWRRKAQGQLEALSLLKNIRQLSLRNTNIEDPDLIQIAGLSQLTELDLSETKITGGGLSHLRDLTNLESLTLEKIPVHDSDLKSLQTLTSLQSLNLSDTKVTGTGISYLKGLNRLKRLVLGGLRCPTAVRDA